MTLTFYLCATYDHTVRGQFGHPMSPEMVALVNTLVMFVLLAIGMHIA